MISRGSEAEGKILGAGMYASPATNFLNPGARLARPRDDRADLVGCLLQRAADEMHVAAGGLRAAVTQQRADDGQAQPARAADRGERMARIVQPLARTESGILAAMPPDGGKRRD